jgi:hypothetical protein
VRFRKSYLVADPWQDESSSGETHHLAAPPYGGVWEETMGFAKAQPILRTACRASVSRRRAALVRAGRLRKEKSDVHGRIYQESLTKSLQALQQ